MLLEVGSRPAMLLWGGQVRNALAEVLAGVETEVWIEVKVGTASEAGGCDWAGRGWRKGEPGSG